VAQCYGCGRKYGFFESKVRYKCNSCGRHGCKQCGRFWTAFTYVRGYAESRPVYGADRYCSDGCAVAYIARSPGVTDTYGQRSYRYAEQSYQGSLHRFFNYTYNIGLLQKYLENPMAQGIVKMYEGSKDLNYSLILEGFKLCRQDPEYKTFRNNVDNLAERYIDELKRFDVPTSSAELGGVTITLTMPQNQKEMKVHSCPSCGATLDVIAVRGQVKKCHFCSSTFQIT
jgi:hypothetical protein